LASKISIKADMPKSLSDAIVCYANAKAKPYKMYDGSGLFLLVKPNGRKYWRLRYYFAGKEQLLALGVYPKVSLAEARDGRAEARRQLAAGCNPLDAKRETKRLAALRVTNSFETAARGRFEKCRSEWAPSSLTKIRVQLEQHVLPSLGEKAIGEITVAELLDVLLQVEFARNHESADQA
jgi:hypothetical protein